MDEATSALIGLRELSSRARFIVVDKHTFDRRGCLEAPLEAERGCRMTMSTSYPSAVSMRSGRSKEFSRKSPRGNRDTSGWHKPSSRAAMPYLKGLCCKPDVGVSQIRTTTVLSSCFCVGQTVL